MLRCTSAALADIDDVNAGTDGAVADEYHSYCPEEGHGLPHDPLVAIVGPRPIGWISSLGAAGNRNLAPYSFFNMLSYRPPLIGFASNGRKDTVRNVEATGEFVWNLTTRPLAEAMNASSAAVPADIDEFDFAGLEAAPSIRVTPPRVARSPVAFECKLTQLILLTDRHGTESNATLVVGEIVAVHILRTLLKEGIYDTAAAAPILRAGGRGDYFEIGPAGHFHMHRPD